MPEFPPPTPPLSPADPPALTSLHPALDAPAHDHASGFSEELAGEESVDRKLATLEMVGEEVAAGWKPEPHVPLAPEVRFLHVSRTIHQLITDRKRSVGIFLAVASILFASSTALLGARRDVVPVIPLKAIQYWCLPVTFGTLAVIGAFMALILVRTRIGLIYEVSKMNALLGLPSERVKRVNVLSIFFLMYLMVVLLGGASAGLTVSMLMPRTPATPETNASPEILAATSGESEEFRAILFTGGLVGFVYLVAFLSIYYVTILRATSAPKLDAVRSKS